MTNATERATIPAYSIPTSKGVYRFSLGDGVDDEYDRGIYRTRKVPNGEDWYWYPIAPLPYVTERIIRRTGNDDIQRVDYRLAASLDDPGVIVTDEEVVKGEWAGRLDVVFPADMDITRATATAIRTVARHGATVAREARAQWTTDGRLVLPPADLLPSGYSAAPSDSEDARAALSEACRLAVDHPKVALMFGAALGGVYLRILGRASFWMLATGESSRGKTSALIGAAALLGEPGDPSQDPQVVRRWDTSPVGLGQWLGTLGCLPVCFDEMATAGWSQSKWEEAVFRSVEGASRTVGGRTGDPRTSPGWRGVLLTTGNQSIVSNAINEAVSARVVEIPTPILTNGADAKRLVRLAGRYRGWAFQQVMSDPRLPDMRTYVNEADQLASGRDGIGERLAGHLALAVAGARMLGELVNVRELHEAAQGAAETILDSLLEELTERGANPGERLLAAVEQAVAARPGAYPTRQGYEIAQTGIDGARLPREVEGLTLEKTDQHTEVAVFTNTLPRIAADAGLEDYTVGLKWLRDQKVLVTTRKLRKRVRLANDLWVYTYSFRLDANPPTEETENDCAPPVPPSVPPPGGTDSKPLTCDVPPVPPVPPSKSSGSREDTATVNAREVHDVTERRGRGVLDVDGLHLADVDLPEPVDLPENLAEAYGMAERYGLSQLWIHPRAARGLELPDEREDGAIDAGVAHPWADLAGTGLEADPGGLAPWSVVWRTESGRRASSRSVVLPGYDTRAPWGEADDGAALLAGLDKLAGVLGSDFYWSPNVTATQYARRHSRSIAPCRAILDRQVPPATVYRSMISPLWSRPLLDDEDGGVYLTRYDLNFAELAGMNTWLGVGEPEHQVADTPDGLEWSKATRKLAGYWRIDQPPAFDSRLPELRFLPDDDGRIWLTTPDVALLDDLKVRPPLLEAWTWPDSRQALQATSAGLRDAREAVRSERNTPAGALAWGALRALYTSLIGYLARTTGPRGDDDPLWRPDWRDHIKAQTYANMYRQLVKIGQSAGRWPAAKGVDAAYYVTDHSDPVQGAPAGLIVGNRGGQWKPEALAVLAVVRGELGGDNFHYTFDQAAQSTRRE